MRRGTTGATILIKPSGVWLKGCIEHRLKREGYIEGIEMNNKDLYSITPKSQKLLQGWIALHGTSVKAFLEKNNDVMTVKYLPRGSSELSAVEECWRQGKDDLLVSRYYPKFQNLKKAIAGYYRTKRFRLDITNYLLRST
ncbi:MAG: transposase, partial [Candidatus Nitrosopolaris sp.]